MKDITIIIPIHEITSEMMPYLDKALVSIKVNQKYYKHTLKPLFVCGNKDVEELIKKEYSSDNYSYIINNGNIDFCSQINYAVEHVDTEYFSILEFDDEYMPKWFKMVLEYFNTNEDVSLFLPVNIQYNAGETHIYEFGNEMAWVNEFSDKLGYIDFKCLENYYSFNLTGGVFNTKDFISVGGFTPDIKVAFNYELLLKLTQKNLRVFVVPKEGYKHVNNRPTSLTAIYADEMTQDDVKKWFETTKSKFFTNK